ncbi:MAG: RNA-binding protein [Candidatus Wallbacteria bacterium]|nr:RNA-binding protein [Candidatus Wallbacteria bacterium]
MNTSKLYVGNIPYTATREQLNELFTRFGTVKEVSIIEGKGFGFVEMSTPTEADAAKNTLNNTDFNGRTLRVDEAKPKQPKREYTPKW